MSNEAAERLRDEYGDAGYFGPMLDEALAAERIATVERIRLEIRLSAFAANNPNSKGYAEMLSILDEVTAR